MFETTMWKLLKTEFRYSMVNIITVYGGSFLLLSLVVGFVAIRPGSFNYPYDYDLFVVVLFWAMMLPLALSGREIDVNIRREKRGRLIFSLPFTTRDYVFSVWMGVILLQTGMLVLGLSFAMAMYFLKNYLLFNTALGINGLFFSLSCFGLSFMHIKKLPDQLKAFRWIIGIVVFIILINGFRYIDNEIYPIFDSMYTTSGIIFLHILGLFFMLTSYPGLKRISPIK